MKSMKPTKSAAIIIAILLVIVLLISGYYYFSRIYRLNGESRPIEMILPDETPSMTSAIDIAEIGSLKWKSGLVMKGWVFTQYAKPGKREVFLVLRSEQGTLVFDIGNDTIRRPDVTAGFKLKGGTDSHGFELFIAKRFLADGTYHVGFVVEDVSGKYFCLFNKKIQVSADEITTSSMDPEFAKRSFRIQVNLPSPNREAKCFLDQVNKTEQYLKVIGWGFLQGVDSKSLKHYVLLKNNQDVAAYDVQELIRPDISSIYGAGLDSTGFISRIPVENLQPGRYQVGLLIVKGDQAGIVYPEKYITIGEK